MQNQKQKARHAPPVDVPVLLVGSVGHLRREDRAKGRSERQHFFRMGGGYLLTSFKAISKNWPSV